MPTSSHAMPSSASERSEPDSSRPRVHPSVAVILLETIRAMDLPTEVLEAEDPTVTMPRRLGLSDAVERQIRRYRQAARKRQRLTDAELTSLIRLAIRRPDSAEVFFMAGESMAGDARGRGRRLLPSSLGFALARRRVRRTLRALFGRNLGGFAAGRFVFEGRALPFIQSDPGGDACAMVTGLCQGVLRRDVSEDLRVEHVACQALGDDVCRWRAADGSDSTGERAEPRHPNEPEGGDE